MGAPNRFNGMNNDYLPIEGVTNAIPTTATDHEAIHVGWGFSAGYYAEGIADNGTIALLIQAPASGKVVHLKRWKPWGEGGLNKIEVFEDPTHTGTTGTLEVPANRNRFSYSAVAATAIVRSQPTITGDGTIIEPATLFGGGGVGLGMGGSDDMDQEFVLKAGSKYLIRCTNLSGSAKALGLWIFWYEEE